MVATAAVSRATVRSTTVVVSCSPGGNDGALADPDPIADPPDPDIDPPRYVPGSRVSTLDEPDVSGRPLRPDAPAEESAMHIEEER
jgi:hypothetical protein